MDIDTNKLESLLAEKKFDEAKAFIKSIIAEKTSDEEKGDTLIALSSVYLDISNSINAQYRDSLDKLIAGLEMVNSAESRMSDKIKIAQIKESLNN